MSRILRSRFKTVYEFLNVIIRKRLRFFELLFFSPYDFSITLKFTRMKIFLYYVLQILFRTFFVQLKHYIKFLIYCAILKAVLFYNDSPCSTFRLCRKYAKNSNYRLNKESCCARCSSKTGILLSFIFSQITLI